VPVLLVIGCGGAPRRAHATATAAPGAPVNPHACGPSKQERKSQANDETAMAPGPDRRTQTFLVDTVALETEIASTEFALRNACGNLGRSLGLTSERANRANDDTRAVCGAVAHALDALHAGRAHATPTSATAARTDENTGAPTPAAGDARTDAALRAHLPAIASLRARAAGPLQAELQTWGRAAADLVAAGPETLRPLGSRAACVFEQLVIAAARLAPMQASLTAQVEASAAIEAAAQLPTG
jgi:hypothetical protein